MGKLISFIIVIFCFCIDPQKNIAEVISVKPLILKSLPHDSTAFTQGLFFNNKKLYESTGLVGQSTIRIVDTNGTVVNQKILPEIFAEGCALHNNNIYQLTWTEQICVVYNTDLAVKQTIPYIGQGWGLTSDSHFLIMSNGSDTLYYRDSDFRIKKKITVTYKNQPLKNINELEFVNGKILANVWYNDFIFEISPETGEVLRTIDCTELVKTEMPSSEHNVLNGIAFDSSKNIIYLTGKNWKHMFLVRF